MARPEKVEAVRDIAERFQSSDAALLTEYRGLTVAEIAGLREELRKTDSDYKVLKNTLARIAVREVGMEDLAETLTGPTAIAFVRGDVAAAAKVLDDAARRHPVLVIKGGVLNGKTIDADQARRLADLEPREVQLAKIAMLFNSPAQQAVNVLSALLRNLGSMLAQVVEKKESGELPAAPSAQGGAQAPAADEPAGADAPVPDEGGSQTVPDEQGSEGASGADAPASPEDTGDGAAEGGDEA